MLEAVMALGLPVRVASNSSHEEMEVKFRRTGLDRLLKGRLHSARDVGRPKPWPDLFLSAAMAEGVNPAACLVVEDSDTGLVAAQAAGMACVLLRTDGRKPLPALNAPDGQAAPVWRIDHLDALEPLLVQAMRPQAASPRAVLPDAGS
jgi:beta-phosphoglucomutase-like phosphatase (HAD superfamily)